MANFVDLTGYKYGRLTVISRSDNIGRRVAWNCKCDCGNEVVVQSVCLRSGGTRSCGCIKKEICALTSKTKCHKENKYEVHENYVVGITSSGIKFLVDTDVYENVKLKLRKNTTVSLQHV